MVSMNQGLRVLARALPAVGAVLWMSPVSLLAQQPAATATPQQPAATTTPPQPVTKGEAMARQLAGEKGAPAGPGAVAQPMGPQMPPKPGVPAGPQPTVTLQPGEAPQIEFDTPVYDFGKIRAGIDVTHDFWFTNSGTGPLEIVAVRPSCGCTQAGAYDHIVQPGQSGKIPLKVAPGAMTGPVAKNITIMTNAAGAGASVALTIKGELWQIVQATPTNVYFGQVMVADAGTAPPAKTCIINTNNGAIATIGEIKSSNPVFKGEIKELEPGTKYELTVSCVPPLKEGNNYGTIEVQTGIPEMPKVMVTATVLVKPELEVTPPQVSVMSTSKVAMKRPIIVRNNNAKAMMKLTDLVSSNPAVGVEIKEVTAGQTWQIMVDLPANYTKAGTEPDVITFATDKPGHELVKVPIIEQQMALPIQQPAMAVPPMPSKTPVAGTGAPALPRPELGTGTTNPNPPAQPAVDPHAGHGH